MYQRGYSKTVWAMRGNVCGLFLLAVLAGCGNTELAGEQEASPVEPRTSEETQPTPAKSPAEPVLADPGNLFKLAAEHPVGTRFLIRVTGSTSGSVWGSGSYTTDSSLSTVAVHAGLVKPGETAVVRVTLKPGQEEYQASNRNTVKTSSYGAYQSSFVIEKYAPGAAVIQTDAGEIPQSDGKKYTLRLNPQPGKTYRLAHDALLKNVTTSGGQRQTQTMQRGQSYRVELQDRTGDLLRLKVAHDQVRNTDASTAYDSAVQAEAARPEEKLYEAQLGQSLVVHITPRGEIQKIEGLKALAERMTNATGGRFGNGPEELAETMRNDWGEQFLVYPAEPVAIGDSWQTTRVSSGITTRITYTLAEVRNGTARIELRSDLIVNRETAGLQTGQVLMDLATGWIVSGSLQQRFSVTGERGSFASTGTETKAGAEGDVDYGRLRAAVGGKYAGLLRVLKCPEDHGSYGPFRDYGRSTSASWRGYTDLPPAYWVYVTPNWYLWETQNSQTLASLPRGGEQPVAQNQPPSVTIRPVPQEAVPEQPVQLPPVQPAVSVQTDDYDTLTFTADSKSLISLRDRRATRQMDYELWLWNLETRRSRQIGQANLNQMARMMQTPLERTLDGRTWVSANWPPGTITVWNAEKAAVLQSESGHDRVTHLSLSPDGNWVASLGAQGNLLLWEIGEKSLKPKLLRAQLTSTYIYALATLNDGQGVIVLGSDTKSIRLTAADAGEDQTLWKPESGGLQRPFAALSPDGKTLAANGRLIDLATSKLSPELPFNDALRVTSRCCWSPDGTRLAVDVELEKPGVLIWNVAEGKGEMFLAYDKPFETEHLEFSPDGTQVLASSARDRRFVVWRLGKPAATPGQPSPMPAESATVQVIKPRLKFRTNSAPILYYLDEGRRIACSGRIIDLLTGLEKPAGALDSPAALVNNGDSGLMVKSTQVYALVRENDTYKRTTFPYKKGNQPVAWPYHVAASRDGGWLAAFCSDRGSVANGPGSIQIWRIKGDDLTSPGVLPRQAHDMAFLDNQGLLVTGGDNGDVALWNPATLKKIGVLKGQPGKVVAVAASTDGRQIAAAGEKGVSHWQTTETEDGEPAHRRFSESAGRVLAFSPSGQWLAVIYNDGLPELLDTATGKVHCRFDIEDSRPECLAFSPDERELTIGANTNNDSQIRLFKLP